MKNEVLYEKAVEAARQLHGDTSVSIQTTRDQLLGLRDEIGMLLDAVEYDIRRDEEDAQ